LQRSQVRHHTSSEKAGHYIPCTRGITYLAHSITFRISFLGDITLLHNFSVLSNVLSWRRKPLWSYSS